MILLIGVGNPGRGDDGLGWELTTLAGQKVKTGLDCEYRYQLQVEDAELISHYTHVIFIDASHTAYEDGYAIRHCQSAGHYFFSSHLQSPETILYLSHHLYRSCPETYLLEISGYEWGLKTSLGKKAKRNLDSADDFLSGSLLPALLSRRNAAKPKKLPVDRSRITESRP